jgi:hypothetical protein
MSAREQPERVVWNPYEFPSCGSATPSTSTASQNDHHDSETNRGVLQGVTVLLPTLLRPRPPSHPV